MNAFADPEDSQLVADAKNVATEPVPFSYTEVGGHVRVFDS
jgi:multifunctional beta-oxidation protein